MKDNLFELLLNLFEKSLTQLQKSHEAQEEDESKSAAETAQAGETTLICLRSADPKSLRIVTYEEHNKLTKASYQFLIRMKVWDVINEQLFELITNQLLRSASRVVTLEETKWTIRQILAAHLNEHQLIFLDLVLYQNEDNHTIH